MWLPVPIWDRQRSKSPYRMRFCRALFNVRAIFDTPFAPATDAYVAGNTAPSGAADVAVAILTPAGAQIDMNGGTAVAPGYTLPSTAGAIDMDFVAAYKSLSTSVTAGPVTGTANYTISYF
jgi:major type 1 subunit fimbrin (pilin)